MIDIINYEREQIEIENYTDDATQRGCVCDSGTGNIIKAWVLWYFQGVQKETSVKRRVNVDVSFEIFEQ